ncbi:MAG: glutathione S-transferase family protein [Burkholderiales bacterium]|nr:glutathione S-transferase family protein [Burkholderiales bacterium]
MKLYMTPGSGNAYKVRVLTGLINVPCEKVYVNVAAKEQKQPAFLKLNPRGEVPVIEDGDTVIWDSSACLVYVARKYGGEAWLPSDPAQMAQVMQWVALAGNEIQYGLQYTRRGVTRGRWTAGNLEQGQALGRTALGTLEGRLKDSEWLALGRPTIGDIACFPYVETAPDAKLPLDPYPGIRAWLARCKALPGWPPREKSD